MTESITPQADWTDDDYRAAADRHMAAQEDPAEADDGEARTASRREATYRLRAKQAEAAATALEGRVTRLQRAEVERLAERMHDPADLWSKVELVELLNEDGDVDPERVAEAVAALADSKPYLLKPKPPQGRGTTGFGQGNRQPVGQGTSWRAVLGRQ